MSKIKQLQHTHKQLLKWYQNHGRHNLPWRNTNDPYHIWVSEIMLQQTQVSTVHNTYYHPFLEIFPTIAALANANESDVLKAWEGLGYYSRARHLYRAAKETSPSLPSDVDALIQLPGIGKNTAHAIAAFAYHMPVPVVEANVKRVMARLFALKQPTKKALWEKAEGFLDTQHPFEYNQAMMDIGAMICTKTKPSCSVCPLSNICMGKENPENYPAKKIKKQPPTRYKTIVVFRNSQGKFCLSPRTSRFLGGLYGFSEFNSNEPIAVGSNVYSKKRLKKLGHVRQAYSHFTLDAQVYLGIRDVSVDREVWKTLDQIEHLPLSRADSKVVKLLKSA